jgi:acetylornithine/succinyldiaminopimelate/putrescine aminotransferase/predicted amino acid dehydrogenase
MEQQQKATRLNVTSTELEQDSFRHFARPLTARLLETMELGKHFFHGEGDYLYYQQDNRIHRALDLTGGYGANILGHRHPVVLEKVQEWREAGAPSLTQGSSRREAGRLAEKLSDTLRQETGEGPWVTTFSNTGTEAIEAAYKHCLIYFRQKALELQQELEKELNLSVTRIRRLPAEQQLAVVRSLRAELIHKAENLRMPEERRSYLRHQLANCHDLETLVDLVRAINENQLAAHPRFLALERAYHGKTMGALSLTYNESFRNPFYLDDAANAHTTFVSQYVDAVALEALIEAQRRDLLLVGLGPAGPTWARQSVSLLAGAFVEPIQGEAGVVPVNGDFLARLKKFSLQEDFLLVFDEIQAGMYRTGRLASGTHTDVTADVYTFSKSLGGGVAKIAATTINQRKYVEEFGFLHTSTFADDDFSSAVALAVLETLQGPGSPVAQGLQTADYLVARLESLRARYPELIKEVRGRGLMLAIEFHDRIAELGFEFKIISDAKMQGYLLASCLLNHEGLRMSPSLSNSLTLRIQPSLYLTVVQAEELLAGLGNLCAALAGKDLRYFLSALYPNQEIGPLPSPPLKHDFVPGQRPTAVFLCHLIDENHIKRVTNPLKHVAGELLMHKLALTKDLAEFEVYHAQTLVDNSGKEMDVLMMAVPITSEELKKTFTSRQKFKVVQKVQNAIDYAKELGASTVGLGQFTSIVSGNGLYLNPRGMNLTTGNAFTIALTVQSALRSAAAKAIDLPRASVALVGAAGNIMSVAASLMADHVGRLLLIHHTPIEASSKFQATVRKILAEIANSAADSEVCRVIRAHWKNQELLSFLEIDAVKRVLVATADVTEIRNAEIVLCGASAANGFLTLDLFRENAVVVDIAVPPSIKPEMYKELKTTRPDLTYHLGGVAQIPRGQSLDFFIFPLGENECYACMAETFSIGFSGRKNFLNIGDLNKDIVLEVQEIAREVGFVLGSDKKKSSL